MLSTISLRLCDVILSMSVLTGGQLLHQSPTGTEHRTPMKTGKPAVWWCWLVQVTVSLFGRGCLLYVRVFHRWWLWDSPKNKFLTHSTESSIVLFLMIDGTFQYVNRDLLVVVQKMYQTNLKLGAKYLYLVQKYCTKYLYLVQKYCQQQCRDLCWKRWKGVFFFWNGQNCQWDGWLSRETTERIVNVGMEWQRQWWCVLVGEGDGYKMTCSWLVSDKTRGRRSRYVFFPDCVNSFFYLGKKVRNQH